MKLSTMIAVLGGVKPLPLRISGLKLWLQADSIAGADGAAVVSWTDLSGNNNTVTQGTADNQPALKTGIVNGKSVVRFDGTADVLSVADNGTLDMAAPCAVFAVVAPSSVSSWRAYFTKTASFWFGQKGGQIGTNAQGINELVTSTPWIAWAQNGVWRIDTIEFNTDFDALVYINNALKSTIAGAGNFPQNNNAAFVGANTNNSYFAGDIAEILVYNRIPTAAERSQINAYLAGRYNLYLPVVDADFAAATRAASPLDTPNPYGAGNEGQHPDVYDAGDGQTWNGYRYWMAFTPLSGGTSTEDPCILASADGNTWVVPDGLTNPIDDNATVTGYFSDTDLVMDSGTLWCFYRLYNGTAKTETIYAKTSTNGVIWSNRIEILVKTYTTTAVIASPAIVRVGGHYEMFSVNIDASRAVERRTCATLNGIWSEPSTCTIYRSYGAVPTLHHLDVIYHNGVYYSFITDGGVGYFMTSGDGIKWQIDRDNTLVGGGVGAWDAWIYRGSLVYNGANFDLWYGGFVQADPYVPRIGRTTITGVTAL